MTAHHIIASGVVEGERASELAVYDEISHVLTVVHGMFAISK